MRARQKEPPWLSRQEALRLLSSRSGEAIGLDEHTAEAEAVRAANAAFQKHVKGQLKLPKTDRTNKS